MKGDGIPLPPVSGPLLPPRKDLFAGLLGAASSRDRCAVLSTDDDLHSTVELPATGLRVARDLEFLSVTAAHDSRGVDPAGYQDCLDGIRATLGQVQIERVRSDAIGITIDFDASIIMFRQELHQMIEIAR